MNTFTLRSSTRYEGSVSARMALSAGLWSNCDIKFLGVTKSSAERYLLPTANMFTSTSRQMPMAAIALRARICWADIHHTSTAAAAISRKDTPASVRSKLIRSATSASTSASCIPVSDAPVKLPARPGNNQNSRQTPPVSTKAYRPFFRSSSAGISSRTRRSRKMNPSSGTDICSTQRAIDTVRNLLYSGR